MFSCLDMPQQRTEQLQKVVCEPTVHSDHRPKLPRRSTITGEDYEHTHDECFKLAQTRHRQAGEGSVLVEKSSQQAEALTRQAA